MLDQDRHHYQFDDDNDDYDIDDVNTAFVFAFQKYF